MIILFFMENLSKKAFKFFFMYQPRVISILRISVYHIFEQNLKYNSQLPESFHSAILIMFYLENTIR